MRYLIRNKKYNNYFARKITDDMLHFVEDKSEAHSFRGKTDANKIIKLFKNKDNYEIVRG